MIGDLILQAAKPERSASIVLSGYGFPAFCCVRSATTEDVGRSMAESRVHLLNANIVIALTTPEHSLSGRTAAWCRKGGAVRDMFSSVRSENERLPRRPSIL
ncbi:MAG TPA: hypothetical protein VHC90_08610 [Bryobacteraceae bacterium]|nr:hypothetical protein [Bryobacteraceae bacterium]